MAHHYEEYLKIPTILVSGGFDPIHKGHCRMIIEAAKYGKLIVAANSDDWLMRKKGFVFMSYEERKEILSCIKGVARVIMANDTDNTVCATLREYKPDYFANGGDRTSTNTPEMAVCKELGITMLWGVGGGKVQSSSDLTKGHVPETNKPVC
jgi:cytidyltransferase-like protein